MFAVRLTGRSPLRIQTPRLDLVPMTPDILRALQEGDFGRVAEIGQLSAPPEWVGGELLLKLRLEQLAKDPGEQPWLQRMMVLRDTRVMIGHIGFHAPPGSEDLAEVSPGAVEFGYTVFDAYRRRGFASEAIRALIDWASSEHGVTRFIASIEPDNVASMNLAHKFGFRKISSQIDPIDGPEDILELDIG